MIIINNTLHSTLTIIYTTFKLKVRPAGYKFHVLWHLKVQNITLGISCENR